MDMWYPWRQADTTTDDSDEGPYFLDPPLLVVPWSGCAEASDALRLSVWAPHSTMRGLPVRTEHISLAHLTRLRLFPWRSTYVTVEARSNVLSLRQAGYAGPCRGLGLRCDSAA